MSDETRKKLAGLSFSEKIKLLEKLRQRSLAFAEARKLRAARKESENTWTEASRRVTSSDRRT